MEGRGIMRFATRTLAALGMLGLAVPALTTPAWAQRQPPVRSSYADGTGDSAVDTLNSGQLDRNYTGPWHQVPQHLPVGGPTGLGDRPDLRPAPSAGAPPPMPTAGPIPEQAAPRP